MCSQLPPFVTMLGGLTKLCLSFTGNHRLSGDTLAALSRVRGLEYLKLIATQLDKLVIKPGALRSMRRLCVVVEVMTELEIQDRALPRLESFRLLCKDLNGFSSTTIQSLPRLKEVTLHDGVNEETKDDWKKAAKNHPRRPKLFFVETKLMGSEPAAEITSALIANDMTTEEVDVGSEPDVEIIPAAPLTGTEAEEAVESEPAAEISPAAATDTMTKEVGVESEAAAKIIPVAPIAATLSVTKQPAISTGESVQVDGDGQNDDDDDEKEHMDDTEDPKDFCEKNLLSTQVIDQMNKESSIEEMEGVAGLQDHQMKDGTQKQGLENKQRLRARLSSLVAIGVFRRRGKQGQLVPPLG